MDLSFIIGVLGNVVAVVFFLIPIKTFHRIVRNRSTEEFDCTPCIITLASTSLWTYYGIVKLPEALLVVTINGFGAAIELLYVALFIIFANSPATRACTAKKSLIINVGVVGAAILIARSVFKGEDVGIHIIGFLCVVSNILTFASPLEVVRAVVMRTVSVEYMPLPLSLLMFLNAGIWTLYAILVRDLFIFVPNAAGVVLATAQLVIYAIYWRPEMQYQHPSQELFLQQHTYK